MAKGKKNKKKNMKFRRQLRKTLGCLFMVSALLVTAIPVQPTEAADPTSPTGGWSTGSAGYPFCSSESTVIPTIKTDTPVYQDETGSFRFVYVDRAGGWGVGSDKNKSVVLVGYEKDRTLKNGSLVIPDAMDAYVKYTDTGSSTGSYAAANKNGKPLYYKEIESVTKKVESDPVLTPEDLNGDGKFNDYITTYEDVRTTGFIRYRPCTADSIGNWSPGGEDIQLYYYNVGDGLPPNGDLIVEDAANWTPVSGDTDGRIKKATVKYIGNQYASYDTAQKKWVVANVSSETESVFGGKGEGMFVGNLVSLTMGENLVGIGNYAFYNCVNMEVFSPGNGLNTLGNYAFANCKNLNTVAMAYYTNLSTLGDHAFSNCNELKAFVMPTATQVIGDFCFENCTKMKTVDMTGATLDDEHSYSLNKIGYKAFMNCSSLTSLTLPASYNGANKGSGGGSRDVFHLSTVQGCKSLKYISTPSQRLAFASDATDAGAGVTGTNKGTVDGNYGFDLFKTDVGDAFYFEAPGYVDGGGKLKTPTHNTANVEHIAFKYLGEDKYEIVEQGKDVDGNAVGLVYAVNSAGDLIEFRVENVAGEAAAVQVPEINMPENIGPYGIVSIVEGSFSDNCWVNKVTIPKTVKSITNGAFRGSHNLKHVIFSDAAGIEMIENGAFATQIISDLHGSGTPGSDGYGTDFCGDLTFLKKTPFLSFSGAIERADGKNTQPFVYAMKSGSKINAGEQPVTYITYYSGLPTNLTVQYNPDTGMSELQDFPTREDVENGFEVTGGGYKFPYITSDISLEAKGAFGGSPTENQANMRNGVENVVIPIGVTAVKEGLFSGLDKNGNLLGTTDKPDAAYSAPRSININSITTKSINDIAPYTFARMNGGGAKGGAGLTAAYVSGASNIGDYAFDGNTALAAAEIGADTQTMGLRPFSGCTALANVAFPESTTFSYENGIIYGLAAGAKDSIVECLESRGIAVGSRAVGPDELAGVKSIRDEAFMNCDGIRKVDLSLSAITLIPKKCFAEAEKLNDVVLPGTARTIQDGAFWNTSGLSFVTIPDGVSNIAPNAFGYTDDNGETFRNEDRNKDSFEFVLQNLDSNAGEYADLYSYIGKTTDDGLKTKWSVYLFDAMDEANPQLIEERLIPDGDSIELTAADAPDHTADGYQFKSWWPSADIYNPIVGDTEIRALYTPIGAKTYTVRFFDMEKKEMTDYTQHVVEGKDAVAPPASVMEVENKVFTGWDRDLTKVQADIDTYAQYSDRVPGTFVVRFWADDAMTQMIGKVQIVKEGEAAIEPAHPTKEGYTFTGWFPSSGWEKVTKDLDVIALYKEGNGGNGGNGDNGGGGNGGNNGGNNGGGGSGSDSDDSASGNSVSGNGNKYTVVVNGGSGSGEYTENASVTINANAPEDGKVFAGWTSSPAINFVDQRTVSTVFRMPAKDVVITANYKKENPESSVTGNSRNTKRNSTTMVDVTKSGISNTGIASANVNGSSDNYVIKITEDAQATAAVIAALEAKYGDLSNIAYLPMDISLYDSTGQTRITDVSGITVDITLPLPDDLIQYAGNNKAASVVNGQLEELGAKFTTIDAVPCIQFTAAHFSPYTIYVDKGNLTEGTVDATPKTGDPIHPKWFLAMGLACISIILFCKKDKGQRNVKTA